MRLSDNTVLITGGASGIGFALAKLLIHLNNRVIVVGRDPNKLAAAKRELPELITFQYDISLDQDRISLVELLSRDYPQLNILVNNAGIQIHSRFDQDIPSLELIQNEIETNFIGPVRLSSLLIPILRNQKEAAIINISSGLAIAPKKDAPIYCATKAALSIFTRALRYQLEDTSISVHDVMTPLVDTNMTKGRGRGKISPDAFAAELLKKIKNGRLDIRIGKAKILYAIYRLSPRLAYRIMKQGL